MRKYWTSEPWIIFITNLNTLGDTIGINIESFNQFNYHTDTSCVKTY